LGHQWGGLDVERRRETGHGGKPRVGASLKPTDDRERQVRGLGELALRQQALEPPVAETRHRGQRCRPGHTAHGTGIGRFSVFLA
jgi:hypothetical protein